MHRREILLALGALAAAPVASVQAAARAPFGAWPAGTSPEEIGLRVAERYLAGTWFNFFRPTPATSIVYPEACTWYGALTFARLSNNTALTNKLIARFEPLFGAEANLVPTNLHVDPSVFGAVPFELYMQTRDPRYLPLGKIIADRQWAPPDEAFFARLKPEDRRIAEEAVRQGHTAQTRLWIDDMYMITALQAQAYRATGDRVYIDRAGREMAMYLDKLQQPNGLFFHAADAPFYWGRGNGWMAAGVAELLRSLPKDHSDYARIMAAYRLMMATLLKHQDRNGMWHQLVDHPELWPETSCTGMFAFAMVTGVKEGWLPQRRYATAARKAWLALTRYINPDGEITEVCEGTNKLNDYQYYVDRKRRVGDLHGQAPLLWTASAFLR